jgi:hypothetical protein
VATVVFGAYRDYIPYYIHSLSVAYPTYTVRIFVTDAVLPARVSAALAWLRGQGLSRFEVRVGCFPGFPDAHTVIVGNQQLGRVLRWLLPPEEFAAFEYGYVGDIDFLVLPEPEPLVAGHRRHLEALGVPYSNVVREGYRRLSGLHFFAVRPYFAATGELVRFYGARADRILETGLHNEEFLYHLVERTLGFGAMATVAPFRPKHGFHLGCIRRWNAPYIDRWRDRPERRSRLVAYLESPGFEAVHRLVQNPDVDTLRRLMRETRIAGATHSL